MLFFSNKLTYKSLLRKVFSTIWFCKNPTFNKKDFVLTLLITVEPLPQTLLSNVPPQLDWYLGAVAHNFPIFVEHRKKKQKNPHYVCHCARWRTPMCSAVEKYGGNFHSLQGQWLLLTARCLLLRTQRSRHSSGVPSASPASVIIGCNKQMGNQFKMCRCIVV